MSVLLLTPLLAFLASSCAPSPYLAADAESEWARCDLFDSDPQVSSDERLRCWSTWRAGYATMSAPERLQHAQRRISELSNANTPRPLVSTGNERLPPVPIIDAGSAAPGAPPAPGQGASEASEVARGVQFHAPDPGGTPGQPQPGAPAAPTVCRACREQWTQCQRACRRAEACTTQCDGSFRACMTGCQ